MSVSSYQLDVPDPPRLHGCIVRTDFDSAEGNHGAVDLVDGTIDLLQVITVGNDLVAGNNILHGIRGQPAFTPPTCFPKLHPVLDRRSGVLIAGSRTVYDEDAHLENDHVCGIVVVRWGIL